MTTAMCPCGHPSAEHFEDAGYPNSACPVPECDCGLLRHELLPSAHRGPDTTLAAGARTRAHAAAFNTLSRGLGVVDRFVALNEREDITSMILDVLDAGGHLLTPDREAQFRAEALAGLKSEVEYAVQIENAAGGTWTSEPLYRRDHAERERSLYGPAQAGDSGVEVVSRRIHAEPWARTTPEVPQP